MAITSVQNGYGVRTASLELPGLGLPGVPQSYKILRHHVWELGCYTTDGDAGDFETVSPVYWHEDALIVGVDVISQVYPTADPGANDIEVATNTIAFMGFTGGNMELMEVMAQIKEYAIGVVVQMHNTRFVEHKIDWNIRWPIKDGDVLKPKLTVYDDNGAPVTYGHYGEVRLYIAEKT